MQKHLKKLKTSSLSRWHGNHHHSSSSQQETISNKKKHQQWLKHTKWHGMNAFYSHNILNLGRHKNACKQWCKIIKKINLCGMVAVVHQCSIQDQLAVQPVWWPLPQQLKQRRRKPKTRKKSKQWLEQKKIKHQLTCVAVVVQMHSFA